jgi:subtilisin family serine protease
MRFQLDRAPFVGLTGRGVRVAVIDSGIQAPHPHVPAVAGGVTISIDADAGDLRIDQGTFADRIGHGTAVAAAIHEKAPEAELWAVKVFDSRLSTSAPVLARAIESAAESGARIINLSLGTASASHRDRLEAAVAHAADRGAWVVAPIEADGVPSYPGSLRGVIGVRSDADCPREEIRLSEREEAGPSGEVAQVVFTASRYPRPIPGVPRERNLSGISFAVANVSGFLARLAQAMGGVSVAALARRLSEPSAR